MVMVQMCSAKNGISAVRSSGCTASRQRQPGSFSTVSARPLKREPLAHMMRGTIVADETWIGGNPRIAMAGQRPQGRSHVLTASPKSR